MTALATEQLLLRRMTNDDVDDLVTLHTEQADALSRLEVFDHAGTPWSPGCSPASATGLPPNGPLAPGCAGPVPPGPDPLPRRSSAAQGRPSWMAVTVSAAAAAEISLWKLAPPGGAHLDGADRSALIQRGATGR